MVRNVSWFTRWSCNLLQSQDAPHLAWAHLPYRRVDIGNLAKSREGQREGGRGQRALQMPASKYEYFVLHFRFALYTLSLHFVSGGKHLTALWARGRSILTVLTASASCCCCCCCCCGCRCRFRIAHLSERRLSVKCKLNV